MLISLFASVKEQGTFAPGGSRAVSRSVTGEFGFAFRLDSFLDGSSKNAPTTKCE